MYKLHRIWLSNLQLSLTIYQGYCRGHGLEINAAKHTHYEPQ